MKKRISPKKKQKSMRIAKHIQTLFITKTHTNFCHKDDSRDTDCDWAFYIWKRTAIATFYPPLTQAKNEIDELIFVRGRLWKCFKEKHDGDDFLKANSKKPHAGLNPDDETEIVDKENKDR